MANTEKRRMVSYTMILVNPLFNTHMAHLQPLLFEVPLSHQSECKIPIDAMLWK